MCIRDSRDTGHILENIVFLELIRRGYTVYVGQLAKGEIDFVAEKAGITEYYQVSETVLDPNTLNRELAPLEAIKDVYKRQHFCFCMCVGRCNSCFGDDVGISMVHKAFTCIVLAS